MNKTVAKVIGVFLLIALTLSAFDFDFDKSGSYDFDKSSGSIEKRGEAREALVVAKGAIKSEEYQRAKVYIEKAYEIYPKDAEIKKYYKLLAAPEIKIETQEEIFFYNEVKDISFKFALTENKGAGLTWVKSWKVFIKNENDKTIKTLSGDGVLPEVVEWNGKASDGKMVEDGKYKLVPQVEGELKGFTADGIGNEVLVLGKKLIGQISIKDKLFPAGKKDVEINTLYPDRRRVRDWTLTIKNNDGKIVRTITGERGLPEQIIWDGKDAEGEVVPQADIFTFSLKGEDRNGKEWESNEDTIESEIEIIEKDGKLTFKMSTLSFPSGSSKLDPKSYVLLKRVAKILKKYSWYNVLIEGHTDSDGSESSNLKLSEARAESVVDYFVKQLEIEEKRFSSVGKGESELAHKETNKSSKAKNRRVEFILTETEKK